MVASKLLTLAFATAATASTLYATPPPGYSAPAVLTLTSTTTVVAKGPAPMPTESVIVVPLPVPVRQSEPVHSVVSSVIVITGTPVPVVPSSSRDYINLSSELSKAGNNLTTSTLTDVPIFASTSVPTGNLTSIVNTTLHHSVTGTATVTSTPPTQTANAGGKAKVGVAVGIIALAMGVLGV